MGSISGVVGRTQRRNLAGAVDAVAAFQLVEDALQSDGLAAEPRLLVATARPLQPRRVQVDLQVGVRHHDGADVASGDDDVAASASSR